MGRKLEMKRIEDNTKCQVTYSKRRNNLVKKAEELSICCEVDIAVLAFSPSGRISKFCSNGRVEDMLARFVDLPADKRLSHIKDIQEKMQKLKELDHIKNNDHKTQHLRDQFENIQLQIKKNQLEVQLIEANLRNFELDPEHESSLQQLSWCENNLQQALEKLKQDLKGKSLSDGKDETTSPCNTDENKLHTGGSGSSGLLQLQKELDPWMNGPNMMTPENIFKEILDKGKGKAVTNAYVAPEIKPYGTKSSSLPISVSAPMHHSGVVVSEAQPFYALFKVGSSTSMPSMNHSNFAFAPDTLINREASGPSQVNAEHGLPRQYTQHCGYDMGYKHWQQTQNLWKQFVPEPLFGTFLGENSKSMQNSQSAQRINYGTGNFAEANNYCWTSIGQDPNPMHIMNQPNMIFNGNANNRVEGILQYGNGNNGRPHYVNYKNDGTDDEVIVSPALSSGE